MNDDAQDKQQLSAPLLSAVAERDVVPVLARQAALLADDASLLESLAAAIDPKADPRFSDFDAFSEDEWVAPTTSLRPLLFPMPFLSVASIHAAAHSACFRFSHV